MKYNVNLTGILNTSDNNDSENATENVITLKQEVLLSDEVEALVENLQLQIDEMDHKIQMIAESSDGGSDNLNLYNEIKDKIQSLTDITNKLTTDLQELEKKVIELEDKTENPETPEDPETPETPGPGTVDPGTDDFNVVNYGAIPNDSKSDINAFTACFRAAKNDQVYIPKGTFNLPWSADSTFDYQRILKCRGEGRISFDDFPQPGSRKIPFNPHLINPLYEDKFGRFDMSRVTDDLFMSMNMVHERRPVIPNFHGLYGPVKTRHNITEGYNRWVPWGQCVLGMDRLNGALPSGNVTFNIGKFGLMIYRESTKKWEIQTNPFVTDGGFFHKTYQQSPIELTRTINKKENYVSFTVPIEKTREYVVHYWSSDWKLTNVSDIKYIIVFAEAWLDSKYPNLEGYFAFDNGLDMYTADKSGIKEYSVGRYLNLTYKKRMNYVHNIMEEDYDRVTGGGENIIKMINAKSYSVDY